MWLQLSRWTREEMEKGDQVKDCLDTGEMNIWTTAGIAKIALDRNDQLAITHPLVQISLLLILLENKTLTCRRRDWREGRKPKKGRNSTVKRRGKGAKVKMEQMLVVSPIFLTYRSWSFGDGLMYFG